jgi:hypothetical protein
MIPCPSCSSYHCCSPSCLARDAEKYQSECNTMFLLTFTRVEEAYMGRDHGAAASVSKKSMVENRDIDIGDRNMGSSLHIRVVDTSLKKFNQLRMADIPCRRLESRGKERMCRTQA